MGRPMNIVLFGCSRNCSQPKQPELENIQTSAKQNKDEHDNAKLGVTILFK